ncbi:MAG: hypothetical protein AABW82_03885 [Nanoarchaeota archaeon]
MPTTDEILRKYSAKIESEASNYTHNSSDYTKFKSETIHFPSNYESWSRILGNIIKINISQKDKLRLERQLSEAHVDVNPSQAVTLAICSLLLVLFISFLISTIIFIINGTFPVLFAFLGVVASVFLFYYAYTFPERLANAWKLKASSQMVPAILYIVVYMKHTSNLERAIAFAAEHLEGPLALDFKKIFYDVEIGKYSTIKQSLDNYLESWRTYAPEFIESMHLVESSLYEPSDGRRIEILEKSLQVILDGVYEKMLKYSREIRSPLTNIYMLGIVLPTLALALLPLASTLLGGLIKWYHVMLIFNMIIPLLVFYMTSQVLLKRPGGYGEASVLELNPDYHLFISKKPWTTALLISLPFFLIGLLPFILQVPFITDTLHLQSDYTFGQIGISFLDEVKIFDFKTVGDGKVGPFGPLGVLFSLFIPLSIGLFFSYTYKQKTKVLIESRNKTVELEAEFNNSLFQLGNRLGDGVPAEIAFAKVADSTQGQTTQQFFQTVNQNIQQAGMSLERALFDKKRGALIYYNSSLISTSMHILTESVKKGLQVAARSLMSISEYVKNIQKINQRLRDLLAEVVSDMKANMTFLAPLLSGIVVGLAVMITTILNKLEALQSQITGTDESSFAGLGSLSDLVKIFDITLMIPPYFLQVIVGLYIIQIVFILTTALVTVDSGQDKLREKSELARNLKSATILYLLAAFTSIVVLSVLALVVMTNI